MILLGVGCAIGAIVTMLIFRKFIVGTLLVTKIESEEQPYLFLDLDKDVGAISNKEYVIFKVNAKNSHSQK